jgi:hypothetical protein
LFLHHIPFVRWIQMGGWLKTRTVNHEGLGE